MSSFKSLTCSDSLLQAIQTPAYFFDDDGMMSLILFNFVDLYKKCRKARGLAEFWKEKISMSLGPTKPGDKKEIPVMDLFGDLFQFNSLLWTSILTGDYNAFNLVSMKAETMAANYCRSALNENILGLYEFYDGAFDFGRKLSDIYNLSGNMINYAIGTGDSLNPNNPYFSSVFGPGGKLNNAGKRCMIAMTDLMNAILGKDGGFSFQEVLKSGGTDIIINFLQNNLGHTINGLVFCNIIYPLVGLSREIGGIADQAIDIVKGLVSAVKALIEQFMSMIAQMQKLVQQGVTMVGSIGMIIGFISFAKVFEPIIQGLIDSTNGKVNRNSFRIVSLMLRDMDCARRKQILSGNFLKAGMSSAAVDKMIQDLTVEINLISDARYNLLSIDRYKEVFNKYANDFGNLQSATAYLVQKRNDLMDFKDRHYREAQADGKYDISKFSTPSCDLETLKKDTVFMEKYFPQCIEGFNQVVL